MNPLHLLPPETAHQLALFAVKHGFAPRGTPDTADLQVKLFGKNFINPVGLAAGADKKAEALSGWARMGFGFVEAGTVTRLPRAGNPCPRLWRPGRGHLINWMGLPGDGMEAFVARLQDFQDTPERKKLVLGASLASPDGILDELRRLSSACAPLADYLTLNVSCPNVSGHETEEGVVRVAQEQVRAVAAESGGCPVLVKLAPTRNGDALKIMAESLMSAGAAGIVATNTVSPASRDILPALPFNWPTHEGKPVGGYSGPALLDTACWMVERLRSILGPLVPVIGGGGIQSGDDALRLFKSGANAVQIYTGLVYKGAGLLAEIKQAYRAQQRQDQPLA